MSDVERFPVRDELLRIEATVPVQGADGVDPGARIDVCMSAIVDPSSISPVDAVLSSGEVPIDVELSLELVPWTGPGGAELAADAEGPWCAGSVLAIAPEIALEPELSYRVRIVPRPRGWDGEALDREQDGWVPEGSSVRFYLEFRVGGAAAGSDAGPDAGSESGSGSESGGEAEPMPVAPTLSDLFEDGNVFDPAREICSCHRDPGELAFERLELTDPSTAYAGLVLETRERDTGYPMVSPRRPSESFLVHKLVRRDGEPLRGVLGDAMPPEHDLAYRDYVAIARWIEAGALP